MTGSYAGTTNDGAYAGMMGLLVLDLMNPPHLSGPA